jgi:diphosphomevalonate decarboxylase
VQTSGQVKWESPSNLAIVKYWGKHGRQLPRNPSISLTLSKAVTRTSLEWQAAESGQGKLLGFTVEGKEVEGFGSRVEKYLDSLRADLPWLNSVDLKADTMNTFPHSSGIASSASGMSAMALCLASVGVALGELEENSGEFWRLASHWARLGSGSAARSVQGPWMAWGETPVIPGSADEHAVTVHNIHPVFQDMRDAILIVSRGEKAVSSTAGHGLMDSNTHAVQRFQNANDRLEALLPVLRAGEINDFIRIAEAEALELHALMMTSEPPYILMQPSSLAVLHAVRRFREETGTQVGFSLDAGPNVHLLYPASAEEAVHAFIDSELKQHCVDGTVLYDQGGSGARQL